MLLPPPIAIGAFTIETKSVVIQALPIPAGGVASWTVQHVISDGEGGPVLLRATLADRVVITDPTNAIWTTTYSPQDLGQTIGPGYWWHSFERLDVGFELVIARGPFQVQLAAR